MNRLGLSGKAFSRAVELIQTHQEFAGHVGLQLPLQHVRFDRVLRLVALDADSEFLDDLSTNEWAAMEAILEVGHPDVYSELFAHRLRQLGTDEQRVPNPPDVIRGITCKTGRFRKGLVKLGQRGLVQALDEALAARQVTGRAEEEAVAEFNRKMMTHFYGGPLPRGKYAVTQ